MKLRDFAKTLGLEVGCTDSGCVWGNQGGMCTNGGCRCIGQGFGDVSSVRLELRAMATVARALLTDLCILEPLVTAARAYGEDRCDGAAGELLTAAARLTRA